MAETPWTYQDIVNSLNRVKETPVITEDNLSHYDTAKANQAEADMQSDNVITDGYRSATVSALLALVDQSRAQTDAIRELTKAIKDADKSRRSTVV